MDNLPINSNEEEVCLFDDVRELAKLHNTITYEITCSLKESIKREIVINSPNIFLDHHDGKAPINGVNLFSPTRKTGSVPEMHMNVDKHNFSPDAVA